MAGSTPRLGLYLPGGGLSGVYLPDEVADIDKINGNMTLIDGAIGAKVVTSTTRPATPFDGQPIYETDTTNTMIYSSAAARWLPVGVPKAASDALRNALYPAPVAGNRVHRTDKGYDQAYDGAAWKAYGSGLIPVKPTSVTGGTMNNTGKVAATSGQSLIRLNGVFTSDFENYLVRVINIQPSVAAFLYGRLSAAGADDSSANWTVQLLQTSGTTPVGAFSSGQTLATLANGNTVVAFGDIELFRPAVVDNTHLVSDIWSIQSGTAGTLFKQGLRHNVAASFDSLVLYWSTGNWTAGDIEVYGYNH